MEEKQSTLQIIIMTCNIKWIRNYQPRDVKKLTVVKQPSDHVLVKKESSGGMGPNFLVYAKQPRNVLFVVPYFTVLRDNNDHFS